MWRDDQLECRLCEYSAPTENSRMRDVYGFIYVVLCLATVQEPKVKHKLSLINTRFSRLAAHFNEWALPLRWWLKQYFVTENWGWACLWLTMMDETNINNGQNILHVWFVLFVLTEAHTVKRILPRNSFSLQFMYFLLPLSLEMKCIQGFSCSTSELVVTVYSIICICICNNYVNYMETVCRAKTNVHSSGHYKFKLPMSSPPVISRAWMQHSSKTKTWVSI